MAGEASVVLESLTIRKFRSVPANTTLTFNSGLNVLVGINGTGKTNLLELISMALAGDFQALRSEDFDIEYRLRIETLMCSIDVGSESSSGTNGSIHLRVEAPPSWHLRLTAEDSKSRGRYFFNSEPSGASVSFNNEPAVSCPIVNPTQQHGLFLGLWTIATKMAVLTEPIRMATSRLLRLRNSFRFNEGLGALDLIVGERETLSPRRGEPSFLRIFFVEAPVAVSTFVPSTFELVAMEEFFPTRGFNRERFVELTQDPSRRISISHGKLWFLREFVTQAGFVSGTVSARMLESDVTEGSASVAFGELEFSFTLSNGHTIRHEALSFGQKRLLSFLYYLESVEVVVADELVNGFHHQWVTDAVEQIRKKGQAFLTSQNPLLLDSLSFESAEDVQRAFILCEKSETGGWSWKNLSADEAGWFFKAYSVGIQQVGELLKTRGLW